MSGTAARAARTVTAVLVGRANAGKTSLLMYLTGSAQHPVNFPGTSVERTESQCRVGETVLRVVDLPGVASLQPVSRDEEVTLDYLRGGGADRPDVLCAVLDATKLTIELSLLQQLRGLGLPIVVALTKVDIATAEGRPVDAERLRRAIGVPLFVVDGHRGRGVEELRSALAEASLGGGAPRDFDSEALATSVQPQDAGRRSPTDRLDGVLLHPLVGPFVLGFAMLSMFLAVFAAAEPFVGLIEAGQERVAAWLGGLVPAGALRSFLVNGLVDGVGAVLVFVPQIALLIALATAMESTGYMARAVFLLDRLLRRFGLTGRSFVPLTSSFACAIPGILASRIIDDERDRLTTIAVAPLMSCSARLPVYVVLSGAFFPPWQAGFVLFGLYLLGPVAAATVAVLLRKTVLRGGKSLLAMELPAYQLPNLRVVFGQVNRTVREFLSTTGTIILSATVVVWLLGYYPRPASIHERFEAERSASTSAERAGLDAREAGAYLEQSYLARIGRAIQPVFEPAGFDWRTTVGILSAFPARELIIPTLGTLYSLGDVEADSEQGTLSLREALRTAKDERGGPVMTGLDALSLMVFFALCSQCISTLGAIRRETHTWWWPIFTFTYMTAFAWIGAVAVNGIGTWLGFGR